jgi:hypothetical protein
MVHRRLTVMWLLVMAGFVAPTPATMEAVVAQPWPAGGIAERIVQVTNPLVGAPYVLSALGEGDDDDGRDGDPRMRLDAFDCTTFVETALALAHAKNFSEVPAALDQIRYQALPASYERRRHFPEAEWLPQLGMYFEDITRSVGGSSVLVEHKLLNAEVWARSKKAGLPALSPERIPSGDFSLDVWPLSEAAKHAQRIPPGTLLHLVRTDFKNVPVRVSHQGIVIAKTERGVTQLYMRHAADRMFHRVVDEPLASFFARMSKYQKWPVTGVHLTKLRESVASPTTTPAH